MSVQKKIERNLLGEAGDLPTSTWPLEWTRREVGDDGGADLVYVTSPDIERRFVYLYGAAEASIEFDLPVDLNLTAEAGYQVRFLYQPTQRSSENPKVRAYFNARAHYWEYPLHTSDVREGVEQPRDWLTCDETIDLIDMNTQPKAVLAFQSGRFEPSSPDVDITSGPENDQPIAQEPGWPGGAGELHFSGKAQGSDVAPEVAFGVSLFLHLKPLQLTTDQPMPELDGVSARYWVEKGGRAYMPICRGGGAHHLDLPVAEDCGWAGGGVYKGTSAYASFTNQDEAGQARLQVTPTEPDDDDDDAQPIATAWEIRNDGDSGDASVDGKTATLRFESVYHAPPHEALACIVGPYKLDIVRHILPEFWPCVAEDETIDLKVQVRYTVSDDIEPGIDVQWRHDEELLTTIPTQDDGWSAYVYTPTGDIRLVATIDSPYKAESDTHAQAFDIKTIPTGKWAQFELSVDGEDISPDDPWLILPGQSYDLTLKPSSDSVLTGEDLTLTVDESRLRVEPTEARPLVEGGLTWTVTTSSDDIGDFTLSLDCLRFKQPPTWTGTTNRLPALTIDEADGSQLDPLEAVTNLTAVVPQYFNMRDSDQISVTWTGAAGSPEEGSHSTLPVEVETVGPKPIDLPVGLIAYALGKSVTVTYTVMRDGSSLPAPDTLTLNVSPLPESALAPSRPYFRNATLEDGAELDVGNLPSNAMMQVDIWPHIAVGQHLWMSLKGHKADGAEHNRNIWTPPGPSVGGSWLEYGYYRLSTEISDYLRELGDGSVLTVEFKVAFNKTIDVAQATTFPMRTYTIRAAFDARAPSVEQATGDVPTQYLDPVAAKDSLTVVIPDYGVQPGDEVSVTWTGTAGGGTVTVGPQPLPTTRKIEVPVSVIAYNLDKTVTVTYTVIRSDGPKPPSAPLTLAVGLLADSALAPSRPRILEVDQNGELDIGSLPGDATIHIDSWPHIAHEQRTWLRLEGMNADESPYEKQLWRGSGSWVSARWYREGYGMASVLHSELQRLRDGSQLKLEFKASFNKSVDDAQATTFPLRTYTVRAAFDARAPSVEQAMENLPNQLDPVAAKDKLTVVIPDYGIQPGDRVSVKWTGAAGGGTHTTAVQPLPTNRKIDIPVSVIAFNLGRSVTVTYTVTRDTGVKPTSAALTLAVVTMAENALAPSRPRILAAADNGNGDELNMDSVSGDITVRIDVWPHIAVGQYLWMRLKGSKADGTVHNRDIWLPPGSKVSNVWLTQGYYSTELSGSYSYLQELGGGSQLTVEFKVAFGQSTEENLATFFPSRIYAIRRMNPSLDSVKDARDEEILENGITASTTLKLTGQASKGQNVQIFEGTGSSAVSKGQATADPLTGLWTKDITVQEGDRRLYAKSLYHNGGPVYSDVRLLRVVELITPALVSLKNSLDQEIVEGARVLAYGEYFLRLSGRASAGQLVEIFDGSGQDAVSRGRATADSTTTQWVYDMRVGEGPHRFYAQSLYHSDGPVYSTVRNITIVQFVMPTLLFVKDYRLQEIPNGGTTHRTTLHLEGQASAGYMVEIFDSGKTPTVSMGTATADSWGIWAVSGEFGTGLCNLYVTSRYPDHEDLNSNIRTLYVYDSLGNRDRP